MVGVPMHACTKVSYNHCINSLDVNRVHQECGTLQHGYSTSPASLGVMLCLTLTSQLECGFTTRLVYFTSRMQFVTETLHQDHRRLVILYHHFPAGYLPFTSRLRSFAAGL